MKAASFFNLTLGVNSEASEEYFFGASEKHSLQTNWKTFDEQPLSSASFMDLLANTIPLVRAKKFLTSEECKKMLETIRTHQIGEYNTTNVWPRVGQVGITQFDHGPFLVKADMSQQELTNLVDMRSYFEGVEEANSLLRRWKDEAGIDIIGRILTTLQQTTGMPTRIAREGDKEYFAGLMRTVDTGIQVHADYAPYNILLNPVRSSDTLIFDRQWLAPEDDVAWRKAFPRYAHEPGVIEGRAFKAMKPVPGDLTFFNPRGDQMCCVSGRCD
ncbi:uncharacterized protein LY89DRAFT_778752 [Mollisia scopiformis]|uniref:Uncharacterized protein n=1 Tax=Mollisia scopiformis TaxID=149040 RepID=A0A194XLX4_MOLSC|nr:uncharacterized protein LY89DRAFT_778752 [Mollisia scopiformis]KUJ21136.1 hypothetical protein LY89DRAFT_778752 [Mollisia scopiformis]